jgi:GntR family transcriptional regulator
MNNAIRQPKYAIVENVFREKILLGEIDPGEKLPSEQEISKRFNVSVITVRKAFSILAESGLIKRMPGKGTFISKEILSKHEVVTIGGIDDFLRIARASRAQFLRQELITPPPRIADALNIERTNPVYFFEIIRTLKGEPFFYAVEFLPKQVGKKIIDSDLEEYIIFDLLNRHKTTKIHKVIQEIESRLSDSNLHDFLKIPVGSPVIYIQRTYFSKEGKPLFYLEGKYRSDRYKFRVSYENIS